MLNLIEENDNQVTDVLLVGKYTLLNEDLTQSLENKLESVEN